MAAAFAASSADDASVYEDVLLPHENAELQDEMTRAAALVVADSSVPLLMTAAQEAAAEDGGSQPAAALRLPLGCHPHLVYPVQIIENILRVLPCGAAVDCERRLDTANSVQEGEAYFAVVVDNPLADPLRLSVAVVPRFGATSAARWRAARAWWQAARVVNALPLTVANRVLPLTLCADDARLYIVQSYLPDGKAAALVPFPGSRVHPREVARVVRDVATALACLHAHGRYMSPTLGNISLQRDSYYDLAAAWLGDTWSSTSAAVRRRRLADAGHAAAYDAPERVPPAASTAEHGGAGFATGVATDDEAAAAAMHDDAAAAAADVWALGMLAFRLLVGRVPWLRASLRPDASDSAWIARSRRDGMRHVLSSVTDPQSVPQLSVGWLDALDGMLAFAPTRRATLADVRALPVFTEPT